MRLIYARIGRCQGRPAWRGGSDVRWVEPKTVIEAHLRGWTADGLVRQAALKGRREDKSPQEVVREIPVMTEAGPAARIAPKIAAEAAKAMTTTSKTKVQPSAVRSSSRRQQADYYRSVWDWMAFISRPLAPLRCPDGTSGQCCFQKHALAGLTEENLHTVIDRKGREK